MKKVKVSFNVPANGHTAVLAIMLTCSEKLPMFLAGSTWYNILTIDSVEIIEKESTEDYKEMFVIEPLINKNQVVIRPTNISNLFFMNCPEIIEK